MTSLTLPPSSPLSLAPYQLDKIDGGGGDATILSTTNHLPWIIPDKFKSEITEYPSNKKDFEKSKRTMRYVDTVLQQFFNQVKLTSTYKTITTSGYVITTTSTYKVCNISRTSRKSYYSISITSWITTTTYNSRII